MTFKKLLIDEFLLWSELTPVKESVGRFDLLINKDAKNSGAGFFNIVLPKDQNFNYTERELIDLNNLFISNQSLGHVVSSKLEMFESVAVEKSEYYSLNVTDNLVRNLDESIVIEETKDMNLFSNLVKKGFGFEDSFTKGFEDRMILVSSMLETKFFILRLEGEPVACLSCFRALGQTKYCLMNGATLLEYRNRKLFKTLLNEVIFQLRQPLYGRTNNDTMRKLLTSTGFEKSSMFYIVKIEDIIKYEN